jgi:hypothetical protein
LIEDLILATETVIGEVVKLLPDAFPMGVPEAVFNSLRRQSSKLVADPLSTVSSPTFSTHPYFSLNSPAFHAQVIDYYR